MKNNLTLLILFAGILVFYSCNKKELTNDNVKMDFFDNGIIKKISLKNKITGSSQIIWFDKSGNVTLFEKKRENIRDGQCIWFYPNGIIQNTSIFKN